MSYLVIALMFPFFCIGFVTFWFWCLPSKKPMDESNRINRIVAWWVTCRHPEIFAHVYKFFTQDVMDNVRDVDKTK